MFKVYEAEQIELAISLEVIRIFESFIQNDSKAHEAGGILMGQTVGSKNYVLKASVPNIMDKSSRYSFTRNRLAAQILVDHEFVNSDGRTTYLGEWHTHPEDFPTPSPKDRRMISNEFKKGKNLPKQIFMIIQGRKGLYAGVYIKNKLIQMKEI